MIKNNFRLSGICIFLITLFTLIPNVYGSNRGKITNLNNILSHINGKKYALVVGINNYTSMPLEAAVNDAKKVSKRLSELNFRVTTLLDSQATLTSIRHELGTKFARTNPNDQIVIYFAGHGVTEKLHNQKMEGYILPVDVNIKDLYSSAISMNELRDLTARIPAKHILFAFDSCYSGLGLTRDINIMAANDNMQQHMEALAGHRAVYMITAGKADEVAREFQGHGLFTLHFLDGIAGAADNEPKDGIVQASELGQYLTKTVSKDTDDEQNPQHGLIEGKGDFLFPLMDDDPIRLRQSVLSKLSIQSIELMERKNIQNIFNKQMDQIVKEDRKYQHQFEKKIDELDHQIRIKQEEVKRISKSMKNFRNDSILREQYNKMKFLNTGIEINVLKIFQDQKIADNWLKKVYGIGNPTNKLTFSNYYHWVPRSVKEKLRAANTYTSKIKSYTDDDKWDDHWLQNSNSIKFKQRSTYHNKNILPAGYISNVYIETVNPSKILSRLKRIESPLKNDETTYIKNIKYDIGYITSNDKLLLFDQFADRFVARYGKPTKIGEKIRVDNWKTGRKETYNEMIWDAELVRLTLSGKGNRIYVKIANKNPIFDEINKQAINLCEAEQLLLLKERIIAMAALEREKTEKASKLDF